MHLVKIVILCWKCAFKFLIPHDKATTSDRVSNVISLKQFVNIWKSITQNILSIRIADSNTFAIFILNNFTVTLVALDNVLHFYLVQHVATVFN